MDMSIRGALTPYNPTILNTRCPACRRLGSFHGVGINDVAAGMKRFGIRVCPNRECRSVLFFVVEDSSTVTFPPEVIDFDASNLPPLILSSLSEAISCHAAGCYRASALLVRRTLEELCADKSATGRDLKARIASLSDVAIIPSDLLAAADELRILGNDAAHVEAKNYDQIGKEEAEVAIDLAKELLKAVYQYTSLVDRLKALKRPRDKLEVK